MKTEKTSGKKPTVTVLIPALNEENIIGKLIKDCLNLHQYKIDVLVVIDSKSVDNTRQEAKKAGAKVIYSGQGKGKGAAVRFSMPYIKGEYVVQIDADYQFMPYEIPLLVEPLLKGFDITLGTRYQKNANVEQGSVSAIKLLGSHALSLAASIAAGQKITDVMAGFKGFKTSILKKLDPKVSHFGYEAELAVKAAKKRYKILNVPITYKKRPFGSSSVSSIKHGLLVLQTIVETGLRQQH